MKHCLYLLLGLLVLSFCPQNIFAYRVHVKGGWGDNIIRSIFPQAPEVSIDSNVLSIQCIDSLSDLTVTVTDAEGNVILKECVSISSGETVSFMLAKTTGAYQIHLNHEYGYLQGDFLLY